MIKITPGTVVTINYPSENAKSGYRTYTGLVESVEPRTNKAGQTFTYVIMPKTDKGYRSLRLDRIMDQDSVAVQ